MKIIENDRRRVKFSNFKYKIYNEWEIWKVFGKFYNIDYINSVVLNIIKFITLRHFWMKKVESG